MKKYKLLALVPALFAALFAGQAMGQAADLPFYSGVSVAPNIMLMIDTSGSMNWASGSDGTRMDVVRTVLTGSGVQYVYFPDGSTRFTGDQVYIPHYDLATQGEYNVLDDIDEGLLRVFLVDEVGGGTFTADDGGTAFVFLSPDDVSRNDSDVFGALSTLDGYLREMDAECIKFMGDHTVNDDGPSGTREIWMYADCSDSGAMTFYDALIAYWKYEEQGAPAGEFLPDYVVPVQYRSADGSRWYQDPWGTWRRGELFFANWNWSAGYIPNKTTPDYSNDTPRFILYDEVMTNLANDASLPAGSTALLIEQNKISWQDWLDMHVAGKEKEYWCPATWDGAGTTFREIRGDYPLENAWGGKYWTWDWSGRLTNDGNYSTQYVVYFGCDSSGNAPKPVVEIPPPTDQEIIDAIVGAIPYAQAVSSGDLPDEPHEFILDDSSGVRLDEYIRTAVGISGVSENDIDLTTPWFGPRDGNTLGGFFGSLYYDRAGFEDLGFLDTYKKVNYGVMAFRYNGEDFPRDSEGDDIGGKLMANVFAWSDFPAYAAYDKETLNEILQEYIASTSDLNPNGSTPIASALHDIYRYFFNDDLQAHVPRENYLFSSLSGYTGNHNMQYDLGYPTATGSENDHIIQDDPYYENGCRRNFLIFLTDGEQTDGEPLGYYTGSPSSSQVDSIILRQVQWVNWLKNGGDTDAPYPSITGVKSFFIGFGGDVSDPNTNGGKQLVSMAAASDMSDDPYDITEFFDADNKDGLITALGLIMNSIMKGQYVRSAPQVSISEGIILTTRFDIDGFYPLWKGNLYGWTLDIESDTPSYAWEDGDGGGNAAIMLNDRTPSSRNVFTAVPDGLGGLDKVDFTTSSASTLVDYFDPDEIFWGSNSSVRAQKAQKLIDFVNVEDGASFESSEIQVKWALGPVYHSAPIIVKNPSNFDYYSMPGYRDFALDNAGRPTIAYVGTMYGLLHAFAVKDISDFDGGEEMFAFIPPGVLDKLHYLRSGIQIYGVDGEPVAADVLDDNSTWKTVLISGLGGGGTEYFALDITDANSVAGSGDNVEPLWTFTDEHLGQTWSKPKVGFLYYKDGADVDLVNAAFFGGGMKPNHDDPDLGGYFYVIDALTGDLLKSFELPGADQVSGFDPLVYSGDTNMNEVPGSPILYDSDYNGSYDWAYIGDLDGRIWKFNFSDPDPDNWKRCLFFDSSDDPNTGGTGSEDNPNWRKPIWYHPRLVAGPNRTKLVYFYTGHVELSEVALDETVVNHMYALMDDDVPGSTACSYAEPIPEEISGDSALWPIEFEPGEKPITELAVVSGELWFKTYLPEQGSNPCDYGKVRLWALNYLTGEAVMEEGSYVEETEDRELSTSNFGESGGGLFDTSPEGEPELLKEPEFTPATPLSWGDEIIQ